MSPASPSIPSSDSRLKWRKRKRDSNPKRQKAQDNDDDDEEEEDSAASADDSPAAAPAARPNSTQSEALSDGSHRISDFPLAVRRSVNRPHPSILALAANARSPAPFLENISHGQLQALSSLLPDHPSLHPPDADKPYTYVCTPPALLEGKGIAKPIGPNSDLLLVAPMHADWFSLNTVHRMERQVVPHFFSGKSGDHTPERYMALRNKIVLKYMENPGRRLSLGDCQGLVSSGELYDLSRIVRFLDHWGIINYLAASSLHRGLRMAPSLLREDANGEIQQQTSPLRSMDSLILFDRPKCSLRLEDIALLSSGSSSGSGDSEARIQDLDTRIRERLSEHTCSYCSCPLPGLHYQSQKEADVILCSECFHDAKFIVGHSSVDFLRVDSQKDTTDFDGDTWTDQETLLLLEGIEKYSDNWNAIAEHVGTKTKAQCLLHFVRLPMEDGLLENIEIPLLASSSDHSKGENRGLLCSNGDAAGSCLQDLDSGKQLPFANSSNPVMSLVAFLASAIGPRVAAACASASLSVLTKRDPSSRSSSECVHAEVARAHISSGHQRDETSEEQVQYIKKDAPLAPEHVKYAAKCGLSAAAMKSKLFADQEEREIQRLTATIINHQLKRLELKLKQFAEVETLLLKECEQVERARHSYFTDRLRMMSMRFGPTGATLPAVAGATAPANTDTRQTATPTSVGQANIRPAYGSNLPGHPHMQFVQRQQMFLGPRLPLSAIHPSPSASSQNPMFTSGMGNNSASNHHSLRSSSGNNTNTGGKVQGR